jgi:hypothetical protein
MRKQSKWDKRDEPKLSGMQDLLWNYLFRDALCIYENKWIFQDCEGYCFSKCMDKLNIWGMRINLLGLPREFNYEMPNGKLRNANGTTKLGLTSWFIYKLLCNLKLNIPFFRSNLKLDYIFRGIQPHPDAYRRHFKSDFALVILRAKAKHKEAIPLWLEALL